MSSQHLSQILTWDHVPWWNIVYLQTWSGVSAFNHKSHYQCDIWGNDVRFCTGKGIFIRCGDIGKMVIRYLPQVYIKLLLCQPHVNLETKSFHILRIPNHLSIIGEEVLSIRMLSVWEPTTPFQQFHVQRKCMKLKPFLFSWPWPWTGDLH